MTDVHQLTAAEVTLVFWGFSFLVIITCFLFSDPEDMP